jgi:hypothetical protein
MVLLVFLLSFGTFPVPQQAAATEVGYVVDETDLPWEAVDAAGAARPLKRGSRVLPGDVLRVRPGTAPPPDAFLSVLLFSTGQVAKIASGAKVDAGAPVKPGVLQRLISAIGRRLDNEALVPGIVRSGAIVADAVVIGSGALEWRALVAGLDPGGYVARFRMLDLEGRPAGGWTAAERFDVTSAGITPPATTATMQPGVWQVSVRHERVPSVSGDAWILVAPDPAAKEAFDLLQAAMEASLRTQGLEINSATVRVRRAALLSLAEKQPRR